ncbi:MAG: hypothetical protein WCL13_01635 [bacterium]
MTFKEKEKRREIIKNCVEKLCRRMSAKRARQGQDPLFEAVDSLSVTSSYHGEIGLVSSGDAVSRHQDKKVSRLAGQYVKILPETSKWYKNKEGVKKIRVSVIPLNLPDPESVELALDYIKSIDPVIEGLRSQTG